MAGPEPLSAGELLKRYRMQAGLTQEELAERAGLSARGIRALESNAQRTPRKDTLALLASALSLSATDRDQLETVMRRRRASLPSPTASFAIQRSRTPMVGRETERALLARHLLGELPPLLLLTGEPGIGKSRLLAETAERAEAQGWTVLAGGCNRRGAQEPYAPCVDALARFLSARGSAQLRLDLRGCAWLVRLVPELAQHALTPSNSWSLPPAQERRLMFAAVTRLLENVAGPAGALLILDDLHWAGADALDLLAALVREANEHRLRVVGAYRDTDVAPGDPLPTLVADLGREELATRVPLPPLEPNEAAQLVDALFANVAVDSRDERRRIIARAGGIPFNLVVCAQEAQRGSPANTAPLATPWTVTESIRQRIARLSAPSQDALKIAAVVARQTPRDLLTLILTTLGYDETAQLHALEATLHARLLIERADGHYTFVHDLIRETVDADLSGARRTSLHRRVADALARLPRTRNQAAELAWHLARGGEPGRALPYALQAGDQAEAVYAHSEAERHYSMAEEWAREAGDMSSAGVALEKRADVLYRLARFTDAYACLDQAARMYQDERNWERLAWCTAQIARAGDPLGFTARSLARLERFFETIIEAADGASGADPANAALDSLERRCERAVSQLTPQTAARVSLCLTSRLLFLSRFDEVFGPSEHTIRHALEAGDLRIESLAYSFRAEAWLMRGQLAEATDAVAIACERARAGGGLEALFRALHVEAKIYEARGEPLRCRETLLANLEVVTQLGDIGFITNTLHDLALIAFALGDWHEATDQLTRSAGLLSHGAANPSNSPPSALRILDAARTEYDPSCSAEFATIDDAFDDSLWVWAVALLSEVDILAGRADIARARIERSIAPGEGKPDGAGSNLALLAWAELEAGDTIRAHQTLARAEQLVAAQRNPAALVDIERVAALMTQREGRWDDALRSLERCLAIAQEAPYPYAEAKARYLYGQAYAATGRQEEAREQYTRALAICERLGERPYRTLIERALAAPGEDGMRRSSPRRQSSRVTSRGGASSR
jgi:transcriptional regulator with XRE-family HTH domain/tetratricopeptide (TPR) repeat protein